MPERLPLNLPDEISRIAGVNAEEVPELPIEIFKGQPGNTLIFHENLLHGGIPHQGDRTRVSIELTLLVKKRALPVGDES